MTRLPETSQIFLPLFTARQYSASDSVGPRDLQKFFIDHVNSGLIWHMQYGTYR